MTPARSLAASVIALGFASSFTAPLPAYAAPAPCERAENYAAQSGAEMLRIDRLDLHSTKDPERPTIKSSAGPQQESAKAKSSTDELLGPASDLTSGNFGDSGQGVTGFLDGTSDLLKSITDGRVKAPNGPLSATGGGADGQGGGSGGQGGGAAPERGSGGQGGGGPAPERGSGGQRGGGAAPDQDASIGGVGLGEARTALIATARTNSAAVARMVDGKIDGKDSLTKPLVQLAPPTAGRGVSRSTPASTVGPLALGSGDLDARAQWDAAMACGNTAGEAARSAASLGRVDLLRGDDGALVRVPEKLSSLSTTALERRGSEPRTVASATVTAGRLTLANGKIKMRVLQAPMLTTSMATGSGGEVQYRPAVVEVSGPGIKTKRLAAAGDSVNISLGDDAQSAESTSLGGLPSLDGLLPGVPLPLPSVPGLPSLGTPDSESAPAVGDGTRVRISLGEVRQATKTHAIAAKVAAIKIAVSVGSGSDGQGRSDARDHNGYGGHGGATVAAELGIGVLEAAAVAPEAPVSSGVSGSGAALPVTGPQAGLIAMGGAGLLVAGGAALFLTRRRRRSVL
jgi:LPXTG-motif cell wall-anchored protein